MRHEGRLDEDPLSKEAVIEPGRLVKLLQKGLLYLAVEAHVNPVNIILLDRLSYVDARTDHFLTPDLAIPQDGTEKACSAPFNLVGPPHVCDGKSRNKSSAQVTPIRLTPEPPTPKVVTSVEASSQTTSDLLDALTSRKRSAVANGGHTIASSSKTTLDMPTDELPASKRKASTSSTQPSAREEKRSRRQEEVTAAASASKQPNGTHASAISDNETDKVDSTTPQDTKPTSPNNRTGSVSSSHTLAKSLKAAEASKNSKKGKKKKKGSAASNAVAGSAAEEDETSEMQEGPDHSFSAPVTKPTGKQRGGAASQKPLAQLIGRAKGKEVDQGDVTLFTGHSAEVFSSAWNPSVPGLIASAGGDATVRIWDIPSKGQTPDSPAICKHLPTTHNKDVSALEWNSDGTLLASSSYDGILRLWTPQGDLHLVMSMHQGHIFAVRWNRKGTMLLTSSADGTAIVWDLSSGKVRQQFPIHSDSVLDVDWLVSPRAKGPSSSRNDLTFATGSADNSINICRVGEAKPIRTLRGHDDEVNAIRFDASQTLLASASDDKTVKVWSIDANVLGGSSNDAPARGKRSSKGRGGSAPGADSSMDVDHSDDEGDADADSLQVGRNGSSGGNKASSCRFTLTGHTKEIYALEWAPTGPGSSNPSQPRMLATTSFDHTARIWNAEDGSCLRVIKDHTEAVYSLCWSPDAIFLATGGIDARVFVTRVADGSLVKAYAAGGQVFDVSWHVDTSSAAAIKEEEAASDGVATSTDSAEAFASFKHQLAVSQSNRTLAVLDLGQIVAQHGRNGKTADAASSPVVKKAEDVAASATEPATTADTATMEGQNSNGSNGIAAGEKRDT